MTFAQKPEDSLASMSSSWQAVFLEMVPAIRRSAQFAFRGLPPQRRDDAVSAALAICCVAVYRLAERGRLHVARPTPLAQFAIRQVCGCRDVGGRLNVRDVLSTYAQRRKQFQVERLSRFDPEDGEWREMIIEDRHAGPADTAAMRIDFAAWKGRLSWRKRRVAELLATGEQTRNVARRFDLSPGRVSQLRHELRANWHQFQGEAVPA